jgi:hypothetical protein
VRCNREHIVDSRVLNLWNRNSNRPGPAFNTSCFLPASMRSVHFLAMLSIVLNSRCSSWSLLPGWHSSSSIQLATDKCSRWEHTDISSFNVSRAIEEGLPGEEVLKQKDHEVNLQKALTLKQELSEKLKLKSEALNRTQRSRV